MVPRLKVGGHDSHPTMDDPWWGNPSMQSRFVEDWRLRFGDGVPEDVNVPMTGIDWLYKPIEGTAPIAGEEM